MPKDLLDDKTRFPAVVRVPVDGDEASGANFELPYQQLSDRTAYLREETEALGVRRVRRVADLTVLRALADITPLELRWVVDRGLYWYDATTSDPEEEPWSVKPTSVGGLWRHTHSAYRSEVERAYHPASFFLTPLFTTNTSWTDAGLAVTLRNARAGERVSVLLSGDFKAEGLAGLYRVLLTDGSGSATELPETMFAMWPSSGVQPRTLVALHRLGSAGDVGVKVQFKTSGASANIQILGPATLVAQLVRF